MTLFSVSFYQIGPQRTNSSHQTCQLASFTHWAILTPPSPFFFPPKLNSYSKPSRTQDKKTGNSGSLSSFKSLVNTDCSMTYINKKYFTLNILQPFKLYVIFKWMLFNFCWLNWSSKFSQMQYFALTIEYRISISYHTISFTWSTIPWLHQYFINTYVSSH